MKQHYPEYPQDAKCKDEDPEKFFPRTEDTPRSHYPSALSAEAIKICMGCDVRDVCLEGALERGDDYGIWGGMTSRQRRAIRRQRKR